VENDAFNVSLPDNATYIFFPELTRFDWLVNNDIFLTKDLSFSEENFINLSEHDIAKNYSNIQISSDCQEVLYIEDENKQKNIVLVDISDLTNSKILASFLLTSGESAPKISEDERSLLTINDNNPRLLTIRELTSTFLIKSKTEFKMNFDIIWADWLSNNLVLLVFQKNDDVIAQEFDLNTNTLVGKEINVSIINNQIIYKPAIILSDFSINPNKSILAFNVHFDTGYELHFSEVNPAPSRIGIVSLKTNEIRLLYNIPPKDKLLENRINYYKYSKFFDNNPIWLSEDTLFFSRRYQTWDQPSNNELFVLERQYCLYNFSSNRSECTSFVGSIFHAYSKIRVCTP
jgi:hypothetical protein